jgi:hypothetical protein
METFFCDVALPLLVVGYLSSVAYCASSKFCMSSWSDPWILGVLLPLHWAFVQGKVLAGVLFSVFLFCGLPVSVVWLLRTTFRYLEATL